MWTVDVRMQGDLTWYSIFSGDGAGAEQAARERHERVRDCINGRRHEPENIHADRWQAVQLAHDGVVEDDPRARAETQPCMPTPPPGDTGQ